MTISENNDTINDILRSVESICKDFPEKYWLEMDRLQAYPTSFVDTLTKSGYLNVLIPTEYGGAGLNLYTAAKILEKIHECGCNASAAHAQMYTMGTLLKYGTSSQKETWLTQIAEGKLRLQAFGVTEPDAGTDTSSIQTTAEKNGNKYIVNGQKFGPQGLCTLT